LSRDQAQEKVGTVAPANAQFFGPFGPLGGFGNSIAIPRLSWRTRTYEDLNIFLAGPTLTTPSVNMDVRVAPDEADRLNVIAYSRTLAETPIPLP
jgi:cytochrome c